MKSLAKLAFAAASVALLSCGAPDVSLDEDEGCRVNADCGVGFVCARNRCVERVVVLEDAGEEEPFDAGTTTDAGVQDAGTPDAGDAGDDDDAGPQGTCDDPFDAGSGPFTFDAGTEKPDGSIPIQAIQTSDSGVAKPDAGAQVWLHGVVATTPRALISGFDGGICTYGAWVSEPRGGPGSGLLLVAFAFLPSDAGATNGDNCPDGGAIPGDLAVGEALSVRGQYTEFCQSCSGHPVAEIRTSSVERLGTAPVPPPVVITASDIGGSPVPLANSQAERTARLLEGTLIQLRNVEVTADNPDAPNFYRTFQVTTQGSLSSTQTTFVHNSFDYSYRPRLGHKFQCITGPLGFAFGRYRVEPRNHFDLVRQFP